MISFQSCGGCCDSILIVVCLLSVLTNAIEVSSLEQEPVYLGRSGEIRCRYRLGHWHNTAITTITSRSSQYGDRAYLVRCTHFAGHGFLADTPQALRSLDSPSRRQLFLFPHPKPCFGETSVISIAPRELNLPDVDSGDCAHDALEPLLFQL